MLSFTFMSDVQFTGWLLIALWLYSRGFESRSVRDLLLGSAPAACAIGTRQFGMALIAAVVMAWLVSRPARRPPLRSLLSALTLSLAVYAWQLRAGLTTPNFTQAVRLHEQAYFLTLPPSVMAPGDRLALGQRSCEYLGLSLLPVLPLLASLCLTRAYRRDGPPAAGTTRGAASPQRSSKVIAMLALLTLTRLLLFSLKNSEVSTRANSGHVLPLPWMLPTAFWSEPVADARARGVGRCRRISSCFSSSGAGRAPATGCATCPRQALLTVASGRSCWRYISAMCSSTTPISSACCPSLSCSSARALANLEPPPRGLLVVTVAWWFGMLVVLSAWMRGDYDRQQARWASADQLLASGTPPRCIGETPPLVGVSRCLRRLAGARSIPISMAPAGDGFARRRTAGFAARAVLRLAAQERYMVRHAPGRRALGLRAGARLARIAP